MTELDVVTTCAIILSSFKLFEQVYGLLPANVNRKQEKARAQGRRVELVGVVAGLMTAALTLVTTLTDLDRKRNECDQPIQIVIVEVPRSVLPDCGSGGAHYEGRTSRHDTKTKKSGRKPGSHSAKHAH